MDINKSGTNYHHRGFFARLPLKPEGHVSRITPTRDAIVLCHMGIPKLSADSWCLRIGGMVERTLTIDYAALLAFQKTEVPSVHQCAGSPLRPDEPSQRVCNIVWGGVPLSVLLSAAGVLPGAKFVWSQGEDSGQFGDVSCGHYLKDIPLARVGCDVLIAYEMNGEPLLPEHGFPARLVVPGYYGTNSVKWLSELTLADERADSPFTRRWYLDPHEVGSRTVPVWRTGPQSIIVSPSADALHLSTNRTFEIWGWAWGDEGLKRVEVSVDDGNHWEIAKLEDRDGHAWQRFAFDWRPQAPGRYRLTSRASAESGVVQPDASRRNALYRVPIKVGP